MIGRRLSIGLGSLVALVVALASAQAGTKPRSDVQELAREGKIRVGSCVRDSVVKTGDQTAIRLRNSCDFQVNVQLCARVSGDAVPNYFLFILQGQSETRHPIWLKQGQTFGYTYNACGVPYCTPPNSDC